MITPLPSLQPLWLVQLRPTRSAWIFDSGASAHMCNDPGQSETLQPHSGHVRGFNGSRSPITRIGTIRLGCRIRGRNAIEPALLHRVLMVPSLECNSFSWRKAAKLGFKKEGQGEDVWVTKKSRKEVLWARESQGCYVIQPSEETARFSSYEIWHQH